MLTFLVLLYFMNICLAQTQNEIKYNPNNFHLFENLELSNEQCHKRRNYCLKLMLAQDGGYTQIFITVNIIKNGF